MPRRRVGARPVMRMLTVPRLIRWIGFLAAFFLLVMTLFRVGTYAGFDVGDASGAQVAAAFQLGLRFDVRVVATAMLVLLVLGNFSFLDPFERTYARRFWLTLLTLFGAGLLIFYVADFLHYRYLHQRLNASVLGFLADAGISGRMVWQSYPVVRLVLGIVVLTAGFVAMFGFLHRRVAAGATVPRKAVRVTWFTATLLLCLVAIFGRLGQYPLRWSDAFNLRNDALANLALNPVQSFISSLDFRTSGFDLAKVREYYPMVSSYVGANPPDRERLNFSRPVTASPTSPARGANVVLVICESFSAYKSSMWGNPLDTTPFFKSLTDQGLFFDNCFTPHFGTARGVWATITGIPDVEPQETASRNPAIVDQHTIINDFTGYEKFYFIGGSSSWANIRGVLTANIDGLKLYEEDSFNAPRIDVWGISDKNLFLEADRVLRGQTKPFFAVIQTADNHRPYTIPKEDQAEFKKVDVPADQVKQYGFESLDELNAFRYTDFAFQKFVEAARKSPYYDNTVFVFIGDHGIGGNAGTMFPPAWTQNDLTSYHVPLLFYAPKLIPPRRIHSVVSQVDVLPTIAGLAGISYHNTTLGRDALRQQEIDGGRSNVAFVIDHHDKWVGLVKGQYFGRHQRDGGHDERAWADFAAPPPPSAGAGEPDEQNALSLAFYETAKYLLLNNKKAPPGKASN